jgi:hypothetical protein
MTLSADCARDLCERIGCGKMKVYDEERELSTGSESYVEREH